MTENVHIVVAEERHVEQVRGLFMATYEEDYPYRHFFDEAWLRRSIYSDHIVMLVAEDDQGRVLGSSSIVLDIARNSDLIGEFGRLAVSPEMRGRGVGRLLMAARLERAERMLHVALVETRTVHEFSQKLAFGHGFCAVGFLPYKHLLKKQESVVLGVHYFGDALSLRRNDPRVLPEVKALGHMALFNCGMPDDLIVDERAEPYPLGGPFEVEVLTSENVTPLLRIERGRDRNREVFGPTTVAHGFFKISQASAEYLLARNATSGAIAGAVGLVRDPIEDNLKIFELVLADESVVHSLLERVVAPEQGNAPRYVEIDVRATARRLQRSLMELGFVPCAYVPAMVFHKVERLDVVRYCRLSANYSGDKPLIAPVARSVAAWVQGRLRPRSVPPQLLRIWAQQDLLRDATDEQRRTVLSVSELRTYERDEPLFDAGEREIALYFLLDGAVTLTHQDGTLAELHAGDLLGESGAVLPGPHTVSARAKTRLMVSLLRLDELQALSRRRPDLAVLLYRNLAARLAIKLRETTRHLASAHCERS